MNCFYHPEESSVATCNDCGKGLCKICAGLYTIPLCNECNLKRVKADKNILLRLYLPSIIFFILGFVFFSFFGKINGNNIFSSIIVGIIMGYVFAGIPWGWKAITFIQPKMFLFISFGGWYFYCLIKGFISVFVGMVALPIGLIKLVINITSTAKKEKDIKNNIVGST